MKPIPEGAVPVNTSDLAPYNSYGYPDFVERGYYVDVHFTCAGCRQEKIWTAAQQKLWYEKEKGQVYSGAKYCAACRRLRRHGSDKPHVPHDPENGPGKDPKRISEHLRKLGRSAASAASREEVESYIDSKKQPVAHVAAQVIAGWGGREAIAPLRRHLLRMLENENWYALQWKAAELLSKCVAPEDESWVVDLFLGLKDRPIARFWISSLVQMFNESPRLFEGLSKECRGATILERGRGLFFLSSLGVTGRESVFEEMTNDLETNINRSASYFLKNKNARRHRDLNQYVGL
jgi:hypothetical protein